MIGTIKTLKAMYGFIAPKQVGPDVFFNAKELVGITFEELHIDDCLTYDLGETLNGVQAVNVQRA